ncbi:nonribosomal peptide synthetase ebony [Arctopsyche grandis]|uniref:nonribosomal peptide synthetase ebony n=1 Tax=Arctopsyche grandis TaxID=121162 RepID=UPI00406DA191
MGSLPDLSILKGEKRNLEKRKLHALFEERLQTVSNNNDIAIIYKENNNSTLTYGQLNETSNKVARSILKQVVGDHALANNDGDYIVAVSMLPSDKLIVTLLAIWKCGAAYLPLDPTFPEQRIKHILKESKPVLVIHDDTVDANYFNANQAISYNKLMDESDNQSESNVPEIESLTQTTENLAIVLYTSGSTGIPKGVRLPHDIILNRLQWQFNEFPYSKTEKICIFKTALTFVDSVCEIWGPLLNGLTLLVIPKHITRDPQKLVDELSTYKIERLVLVPSLLRSLLMYLSLNNNTSALRNLKLWVSSGEPLAVSLAKEFFQYFSAKDGHVLCNFYGSTEVMGDVTYYSIKGDESLEGFEKVPIGYPVDNTIIYLLDQDLRPVSNDESGELWVSGCNLAAGYVNGRDPDRFIANPLAESSAYSRIYRTGDFAKIYKGTLFYEGRTDSQIKIRGHRVDLSEVEKSVLAIDGIDKGVVLCYKAGEMDQALLAFVTSEPTSKMTGLKVESLLQDKLATYMIPQVIILDNIPLLVNGKVDRQSLLKMYENTNNNDDSSIILDIDYTNIPKSKMTAAEVLFHTVGSVIGRSTRNTLSVKSNYYELGGNSLNSIYTITQLKKQGYLIGITDFIMAKNLGEVLNKMCSDDNQSQINMEAANYVSETLNNEHKKDGLSMIVSSFYEKADLEHWLKPEIKECDYNDLLNDTWKILVDKGLSFIVRDQNSKPIAIALNVDVRDEADITIEAENALVIIFEFLEHVEGSVREQHLPQEKGKIVHSFMMATHQELTAQENIAVIQFMEEELVQIAKKKGYIGIFTTNTSPLTQQLGSDILGYETLLDYQVNQFVSSTGRTPFAKAPDSQRALVCLKKFS